MTCGEPERVTDVARPCRAPVADKNQPGVTFTTAKTELGRYENLGRATALINALETDLFENAVIPIALAHRFTAISLKPGGQVLDVLTRTGLAGHEQGDTQVPAS